MIFMFMNTLIYAQGNYPPPPGPPPVGFPIDDNIVILVAAGILFGAYKIFKHKRSLKA